MSLGTSPAPGLCCLAAQEGCGVRLGEPGAMVPTRPMPLTGAAGGFHLAWLKLLFLAILAVRWLQRRQTIHAGLCQLSWQNRWPCHWSCVLGNYGSDAENRGEQPPDLTYLSACIGDLCHSYILPPTQNVLEATYLFLFAFRGDRLTTSPFIISHWQACAGSTDQHKCVQAPTSCQTLQKHNFLSASHVTTHELTH